jgi:tetratricopeptide (TPR) repeat protein
MFPSKALRHCMTFLMGMSFTLVQCDLCFAHLSIDDWTHLWVESEPPKHLGGTCSAQLLSDHNTFFSSLPQRLGEQDLWQGNPLKLTAHLSQVLKIKTVADKKQILLNAFLKEFIDHQISGNQGSYNDLERIVTLTPLSYRASLLRFLQDWEVATQKLNVGYSYTKSMTLSQLVGYYQKLGENPRELSRLMVQSEASLPFIRSQALKSEALFSLAHTYVLINKFKKSKILLDQAIDLEKKLQSSNPNERQWHWQPIIVLAAKLGEWEKALGIAHTISDITNREQTYSILVREALKQNRIIIASQLAETLTTSISKAGALTDIAEYYLQRKEVLKADRLFLKAVRIVLNSEDLNSHEILYPAQLIERYAKSGQFEVAWKTAQTLTNPHVKANAFIYLSSQSVQQKRPQYTSLILTHLIPLLKTLDQLQIRGQMPPPYFGNEEVDSALDTGQYRLAYELARRLRNVRQGSMRDWAMNKVLERVSKAKQFDIAFEIVQEETDSHRKVYQVPLFVSALTETDNTEKALAIANSQPVDVRIPTLAAISATLFKIGKARQAQLVLNQAQQVVESFVQPINRPHQTAIIALALYKAQQFSPFKATIQSLLIDGQRSLSPRQFNIALMDMAYQYSFLANEPQIRLDMARLITDPILRSQALSSFTYDPFAFENLDITEQVIPLITEPTLKLKALLNVANYRFKQGKIQEIPFLLNSAWHILRNSPGADTRLMLGGSFPRDRATVIGEIAVLLAKIGNIQQAFAFTQFIQNPARRNLLRRHLLCYL